MKAIPGSEGHAQGGDSRMQHLDAPLLLNVLSFACGAEALEHWRGETADCLLCPMSEGEAIPMISAAQAAMRGRCRLVCRDWCRVLGGPTVRHCGFRSQELPSSGGAGAGAGADDDGCCSGGSSGSDGGSSGKATERAFGPWNGPKLFAGARSVTMAVSLSMVALDVWHEELVKLCPHAVGGGGSGGGSKGAGQGGHGGQGGKVVSVRLNVKRTNREAHGEWEAVLRERRRRAQTQAQAELAHGGAGVDATDEEDSSGTEGVEEEDEVGVGMGMEGVDSDEEAGAVFGPPPPLPGGMMLMMMPPAGAMPAGAAAGAMMEEEPELAALQPPPPPQQQHVFPFQPVPPPPPPPPMHHHPNPHVNVVGGQQDGGMLGGLGGAVFGAGVGDAQLEAEEEAIDAISSHPWGLRRPQPLALPRPPPPRAGFVLREVSLAHLSSQDGANASRAPHAFFLKDEMVYTLLRHLPPTLERLSLARNPHLYVPLAPLAIEPLLPNLRAVYLDGCWRVCVWHLRVLEAARPPPRFFIDLLHEDFGNGRGLATGGRPCGMKEVVILNGKHRGAWVKCLVIHKAGPLRYHIKVLPTTKFDSAVGFSGRPALDVSRRHLRHHCSRKEEAPAAAP